MSEPCLKVRLPNQLPQIGELAEAVERFCEERGIPQQSCFHVNLVLDEMLTNIISYAYDDEAAHEIDVRLDHEGDRLAVEIVDDGRAFDPLSAAEPDLDADIDERAIGGLGVHFLRTLMRDIRYDREDGRNRLRFAKALDADEQTR